MGLILICIVDIGNGISLEKVDFRRYVWCRWRMWISSNSQTRVRSVWKKFREYLPIL